MTQEVVETVAEAVDEKIKDTIQEEPEVTNADSSSDLEVVEGKVVPSPETDEEKTS